MLLESFTLHQMIFSTFLYKFYPCLQSWSVYSSMVHKTIWHTVISLWMLSISPLCVFPPACVPLPYPKGCLYSYFILLVSLLFFSCLSFWWIGCLSTSHSLKKNFPSDSFIEPNLTHLICTQTEIQSWVKEQPSCCREPIFEEFLWQRPQIGLCTGSDFTHKSPAGCSTVVTLRVVIVPQFSCWPFLSMVFLHQNRKINFFSNIDNFFSDGKASEWWFKLCSYLFPVFI